MKRTLALLMILLMALSMTGCSDRQVKDALIDMGYAPANPDQTPFVSPTPTPEATLAPTPSPTPRPDNIDVVGDDVISIDGYPEKIKLNKKELTLNAGQSRKLKATLKPKKVKIKDVVWSSSDETVAIVSDKGKVTAIAPGAAVISCETANGLKAVCEVTVKQKKPKAKA